jgi:hypothetical protein
MAKTVAQFRDELADREAIRDVLYRYCRSNDRCDEELLRSCYWPDAEDDHMDRVRGLEELVAYIMPALRAMRRNQHHTGNVLISIDGNRAEVESYVHAYHCPMLPDGERRDVVGFGRYLDVFEKRDDEWRILKRVVVTDWFHDFGAPPPWEAGPFGPHVRRGELKPDDKSYELFHRL